MKRARNIARWIAGALVMFVMGNGIGYVTRTYECRNDRVRIYVAAPGYEASKDELPRKLYSMKVTRCTLPEQWGGQREPLEGYP